MGELQQLAMYVSSSLNADVHLSSPDELWNMKPENATYYRFRVGDDKSFGIQSALESLKLDGCQYATEKWLTNHWSMILWKIAGEVLAKPELYASKWKWHEILSQLRYRCVSQLRIMTNLISIRYEREFGATQRPIIRRIHEHDSSSNLPMTLCVSAIHRRASVPDDTGRLSAMRPFLELTDGWYRINAEVDDCLVRAIDKGKIMVGRKLSVFGARVRVLPKD